MRDYFDVQTKLYIPLIYSIIIIKDDIPIPASYKNYLLRNCYFVLANLRFWDEVNYIVKSY